MAGYPERRFNRKSPVVHARDAFITALFFVTSPSHAQEIPTPEEVPVVAFSGANFDTTGGLMLTPPGERFPVSRENDETIWQSRGGRRQPRTHECAIAPADTFEWGGRDSYRDFNWNCANQGVDMEREAVDGNSERRGFNVEGDLLTYRIPR